MSRPIPRIALALLISLALLAAIYVTVVGASADAAGARGAQARMMGGLNSSLSSYQPSGSESPYLQSSTLQKDGPCHSEAQVSPLDY